MQMSNVKKSNLLDQPTIVQSIQQSEARTRLQKAKLAKSPESGQDTDKAQEDNMASLQQKTLDSPLSSQPLQVNTDICEALNKVQQSILAMETKVGQLTDASLEIQNLKKVQTSLRKEAKNARFKVSVLTNVVIRLEEKVEQQAGKIVQMQARSMRKNLIISGLDEPKKPQVEKQEDLLTKINDFMLNKLKMSTPVQLKVFHRFGAPDGSGTRPVVVKVHRIEDKFAMLAKGPQLKDLTNAHGKKYYISEQLPDVLQEERRYNQFWVQENKQNPSTSKPDMKITKNKLRINNEPYKKKVQIPNAAEILRLDDDELTSVRSVTLYEGGTKDEQGSEFLAFSARVQSTEDVRRAYRKLKIKYADASHISSAFSLAPPNGPYNQEANDDGEHGMGRMLLKLLHEAKATNIAVFLLRYFGGVHIGPKRFDIAKDLTKQAIRSAGAWRQFSPALRGRGASRSRGRSQLPSRQTVNRQPNFMSQSDRASDTEPEVVRQFKASMDQVPLNAFDRNIHTHMQSSDDNDSDKPCESAATSEQEYDASHEEETDYDEALSQTSEMPPLETTQQQESLLQSKQLIRNQLVQPSSDDISSA